MVVVKIYKVTCEQGYNIRDKGTRFSLTPWGEDTVDYKGYDDGGVEYILPDGYEVAETVYDEIAIFKGEEHCSLISEFGKPALITEKDNIILKVNG